MKNIILKGNVRTTIQIAPTICKCTYCKKQIDTTGMYLRFTGEYLHPDCLIEYMQKIDILKVITPEKDGDKNDE